MFTLYRVAIGALTLTNRHRVEQVFTLYRIAVGALTLTKRHRIEQVFTLYRELSLRLDFRIGETHLHYTR